MTSRRDAPPAGGDCEPSMVALGVDGMEPSLLEGWIDAGELPNLAALRESGVYGTAECSSVSSAKQWTTHFTGVTPDGHGIDGFLKSGASRRAGDDAPDARELVNRSDIQLRTYPELLAEDGVSVGLINPLPLWPPLELEGGFCVSGMLTPPTTDRWVHPPDLKTDLDALDYRIDVRYGDRPYGFVDDALFDEVDLATLREDAFDVLDARIAVTKRAVTDCGVEYLYVLLKSIDVIQHCFWAHMEKGDPAYGEAILEAYRRVDDLVGWLGEETEANVLAFSDHGFGPRIEEPPVVDRIAGAVASRVDLPSPIKRAYDRFARSPVDTEADGVSVTSTTGVHADPAAWILDGPDVTPGGPERIAFEDLTPTVLALLGQPVPEPYVGTAVDAVRSPSREDRSLAVERVPAIEDGDVVSERLHNLGYADLVEDG